MNEKTNWMTQPFEDTLTRSRARVGRCGTCGASEQTSDLSADDTSKRVFVYAVGKIEARFPNLAAEKEFAQSTGRMDPASRPDQQTLKSILSRRESRYLARQLCWVLGIDGLDAYLLVPRDPSDIDLLVDAIRPAAGTHDIDVVVGIRGPVAAPAMCNGLTLPILIFDQIYSAKRDAFIKSLSKHENATEPRSASAAEELLGTVMQLTQNTGATNAHRAVNYLTMRYPAIYGKALEQYENGSFLTAVDVRPHPVSSSRNIVDVVFSYTNRKTNVTEKSSVSVDVTEQFPFLVTKISPYLDCHMDAG